MGALVKAQFTHILYTHWNFLYNMNFSYTAMCIAKIIAVTLQQGAHYIKVFDKNSNKVQTNCIESIVRRF